MGLTKHPHYNDYSHVSQTLVIVYLQCVRIISLTSAMVSCVMLISSHLENYLVLTNVCLFLTFLYHKNILLWLMILCPKVSWNLQWSFSYFKKNLIQIPCCLILSYWLNRKLQNYWNIILQNCIEQNYTSSQLHSFWHTDLGSNCLPDLGVEKHTICSSCPLY